MIYSCNPPQPNTEILITFDLAITQSILQSCSWALKFFQLILICCHLPCLLPCSSKPCSSSLQPPISPSLSSFLSHHSYTDYTLPFPILTPWWTSPTLYHPLLESFPSFSCLGWLPPLDAFNPSHMLRNKAREYHWSVLTGSTTNLCYIIPTKLLIGQSNPFFLISLINSLPIHQSSSSKPFHSYGSLSPITSALYISLKKLRLFIENFLFSPSCSSCITQMLSASALLHLKRWPFSWPSDPIPSIFQQVTPSIILTLSLIFNLATGFFPVAF